MGKKGYTCLFENQLSMISTSFNNPSQPLLLGYFSLGFYFIYVQCVNAIPLLQLRFTFSNL